VNKGLLLPPEDTLYFASHPSTDLKKEIFRLGGENLVEKARSRHPTDEGVLKSARNLSLQLKFADVM
jgi:hypothetical protein